MQMKLGPNAGGGRFKVKLNHFSFGPTLPTTLDVFQAGNLICVAQPGAGAGIEIRYNHGVRWVPAGQGPTVLAKPLGTGGHPPTSPQATQAQQRLL